MNRSSETGGYVLSYERPLTRKVAESVVKQFAEQTQSNNAVELNRVFAALGIQPELSTQLQTHLARITEASMLSEIGIQQLQQARFDYDNRVRSALSPDDYLRYRQYEDAKPAEKEFGKLEDYAKAQGLAFDPNDQPAVVSLIQQFHAYTESSWHGPYDVVPDPAYGDVQVFARVNSEIVEIGDKAKQVDLAASTSGVSEAARNLLAAYYNRKIEDRQNALEDMRNPVRDPATLSLLLDRQLQASGVPVPLSTNRVP